ncbi:flagellar basal body-associated FliL family protein [Timonella sp. A28]|uniref:flagellar basal body-associated FliL family protein n=1 Tax=Timonella sp. A28 TaxID=3442640 RepID=UPI003EBBC8C2
MPIEQRVVSGNRPAAQPRNIADKQRSNAPAEPEPQEKKKKNVAAIILTALLVVLLIGGAVYWFVLRPASAGPKEEPEPVAGEVHVVESINLNLADGHYLRLGFAVQLTDQVKHIDDSKILDTAIALYSGQTYEDVLDATKREALKMQLAAQLEDIFHGEIMDVYLTDYVAQ